MYSNNFKQLNLSAGVRQILWLLLIFWLLSIGGGFLLRGFVFILGLIVVAPVVGFFGLQWWLRSNVVQSECPVCQHAFTGLNNQTMACPNCGESIQVVNKQFQRVAEDGVIDIAAVEVSASVVEESELS
ncbi:MAG: hypothetical protein HC805_05600 [Alkalinema sp. RL_2_19]|nr:hypothetical protein [Alkalinema sp. RL_2_19]